MTELPRRHRANNSDPLTLLHHDPGFVAHALPVPGNAHRE
jgi:hypothetical protein